MTMTYEQRLGDLATEMAKAKTPKIYEMKLSQSQRDSLISSYLPLAAIALKHMAYWYGIAYITSTSKEPSTEHLQSLGLVPQKP